MLVPDSLLQNRYRVVRLIGKGGMGAVYEAVDLRLKVPVALKQTVVGDTSYNLAFEREARLLAVLRHPALPRVIDHFADGNGQFLAMEFVPGEDLGQILLRRTEPFPPDEVLGWAEQLLDALEYLHAHDPPIIHRDIKPQNIKLTTHGAPVLLDFGLAKGADAQTTSQRSIHGFTLSYAPPEQLRGESSDPRSDLYALAATVYDLMTATKPPDALRRATELLAGRPDPLRLANEVDPQISQAVALVLQQALALDPAERPARAAELSRALRLASERTVVVSKPALAGRATVVGLSRTRGVGRPSGTITLLFTDIKSSTRLWEQYPQAMRQALHRHDAILREVITAHDGYIFKTVGDAFYAAFAVASDALAAAVAVQRALAAGPWEATGLPGDERLHVRIALHSGAAEERDGDYFGPPLNRAARLLATGDGGQILLSLATQELVRDFLEPGVALMDLGEHRLKDLTRPERIYQVAAPDLPAEFAPLKTVDSHPNNLPAQPNQLLGRAHDLAAVCAFIRRPDTRLLTLTGPGGTGKTRLGLQAAAELLDDFAEGVYFVELAPIRDPDLVLSAIAQVLGVKETGSQLLAEGVKEYLCGKHLLLLLDNFEQVVVAAPLVADLLSAAPRLKMLATSREALHLSGEQEYPVPPLALPDVKRAVSLESLSQYAAVELFIQRALAARPDFQITNANAPAVAEICVRLDGLPLAIELAAARIKSLTPQAILARLQSRLKLLTGGARDLPTRQQTLRSAIDWSYDLLDEGEKLFFLRLAVFVGGRTLEAIEAVCNSTGDLPIDPLDGIQSLIDKNLVYQVAEVGGEPRYMMLETIWEYALARLAGSGEQEALRHRHAQYYLALAEQAAPELRGRDQRQWMHRLETDHDNLRAAIRWSLESANTLTAARIAGAMWRFWYARGYLSEGRRWLEQALSKLEFEAPVVNLKPGEQPQDQVQASKMIAWAEILNGAGVMARNQGDYQQAHMLLDKSLAVWRDLANKEGMANALNNLGTVADDQSDYMTAAMYYEKSLSLRRETEDQWGIALSLNNLGHVALAQGTFERAAVLCEESLALFLKLGDKWGSGLSLSILGEVAYHKGDLERAITLQEQSLNLRRELGDRRGIAQSLNDLGLVASVRGDYLAADTFFRESLALWRELGDTRGIAISLEQFAALSSVQGAAARALCLAAAASIVRETIGAPLSSSEHSRYDGTITAARDYLSEAAFAAAWAAGRAMTLDQAIAYALEKG
jgi:predicted ATPase/class 3 adenylate cyclase